MMWLAPETRRLRLGGAGLRFLLCLVGVLCAGIARGDPYAEWVDDAGLPEASREIVLSFRKSRMPDQAEVPFPKYPNAVALLGDTTVDAPLKTHDSAAQTGLLLISKDDLPAVAMWYEAQLLGYSRFDYEVDGRAKVVFVAGWKDFDYQRDSVALASTPHVIVAAIGLGVKTLVEEYSTVIELAYQPSK